MSQMQSDLLTDGKPITHSQDGHVTAVRRGPVVAVRFMDTYIVDEMVIDQIDSDVGRYLAGVVKPQLVMDFSAVEHMSSRTLTLLINLDKKVRGDGGRLFIVRLKPQLHEVFAITRLDTRLNIVDDTEDLRQLLRGV